MLQLFGSGLISLWLDMAGLRPPLDILELLAWQASPGLVLVPDSSPVGATIVQQYLKKLAGLKLSTTAQGVWIQSGPILVANHQGTVPLPAASLTKIATSLAALKTWGPSYQFETLISATGPVQNGVLQGDLVIQGSGDPFFVWEEAIALGNRLNQLGINRVTGNLVITGNFAMNYKDYPSLAGQMLKQGLNAASWNSAVATRYLKNLPKGTALPRIIIAGSVQVEAELYPKLPFLAPLLPSKQILLLRHRSLPLAQIIKEMNIYSNNEMATMLANALGGARAVQERAAKTAGVPPMEIQMVNGSGLGIENRISPRAVCAMFMAIQRELLPHKLSVADLFPVAGRDRRGTVETRHIPTNTVIKTGTLNDVSALAGVMPTRDRGLVWFAIINRGGNVAGFRAAQDQLLQRLLQQWQVTALPAPITPHPLSNISSQLGEPQRNEILYKG